MGRDIRSITVRVNCDSKIYEKVMTSDTLDHEAMLYECADEIVHAMRNDRLKPELSWGDQLGVWINQLRGQIQAMEQVLAGKRGEGE